MDIPRPYVLKQGHGEGEGHWAMASTLGAEGAPCGCSAPSNRECFYRENVIPQAPSNDEKSLRKFLQGLFGPESTLRHHLTTKSSSEKSLQ